MIGGGGGGGGGGMKLRCARRRGASGPRPMGETARPCERALAVTFASPASDRFASPCVNTAHRDTLSHFR